MAKAIIFFHGYGGSGDGLSASYVREFLSETFPQLKQFYPNAPFNLLKDKKSVHERLDDHNVGGYYWFPLDILEEKIILSGIKNVIPIVYKYIDKIIEEYNLEYKDIILAGFSQGTSIANYLALETDEDFAGVISFSGGLIMPSKCKDIKETIKTQTPFCFIHGNKDRVLNYIFSEKAHHDLLKHGIKSSIHIVKNLDHDISDNCLEIASDFIKSL